MMKKIIIVFESLHYNEDAFAFISALNKVEPVSLTAVFLSPVDITSIWAFPVVPGNEVSVPGSKDSEALLAANIASFKTKCSEFGIRNTVHNDVNGIVFEEVKTESRFSDLMIINTGFFYKDFGEQPNDYLKEVLHIAECPVLLLPERSTLPQSLSLMYDGSESAMFAIRQFAYLFPVLRTLNTTLVYVDREKKEIPEIKRMEGLIRKLYPNCNFETVEEENHYSWFEGQTSPLIVTGAYGRPAILEFLRKSFLTEIINDQHYYVFLAHK